jgi:hypothetical protein
MIEICSIRGVSVDRFEVKTDHQLGWGYRCDSMIQKQKYRNTKIQ